MASIGKPAIHIHRGVAYKAARGTCAAVHLTAPTHSPTHAGSPCPPWCVRCVAGPACSAADHPPHCHHSVTECRPSPSLGLSPARALSSPSPSPRPSPPSIPWPYITCPCCAVGAGVSTCPLAANLSSFVAADGACCRPVRALLQSLVPRGRRPTGSGLTATPVDCRRWPGLWPV